MIEKPVAVRYGGMLPSTSTWLAGRPVSSCASRRAAATGVESLVSMRPPGKLIWPAWSCRCAARWVSMMCTPLSRVTSGINTAAGTGVPSRPG
ncbi:hypothetical protein G6F22_021891 [Rhizopus arrhizus]|nr:hypothetical protein G6F22_021891 [Rhizopus arrhizus]